MKKTRRFVALLLAAVLALALFTACGAAEQPQSAIGKVYDCLLYTSDAADD